MLGSPSLIQLLRICPCRASRQGWSLPRACLGSLTHLFALPLLSSMLGEPCQVYLPLNLPLAQCAGASCATAAFWVTCISEQMCVCWLMGQRLKPTWFPFLSYSVSLHLEKDAFFSVIFLIFYLKVFLPCQLHLLLSYEFDAAGFHLNRVESLMHLNLGWNKKHKGKRTALKLL